jgi:coenzyme F420 hydrogenase subunit beta
MRAGMRRKTELSFDDLLKEVVDRGLCNKCGACVSFCTAHQIGAIKMYDAAGGSLPGYADPDKCFKCGICYLICPQTRELDDDVGAGLTVPTGALQDVVSARATDPKILEVATDGGVVTALLSYMLESRAVDGVIAAKRTGLFSREPVTATTREELIQAAGSQFSESSHLGEVGETYSTYVPVFPVVKAFEPKQAVRLAVVGTPCQITAIRKMQTLNILPADAIHFTVGLFCMQCFGFDNLMGKTFVKKYHIVPEDILGINVKEDFRLKMNSGVTIHVPFGEIEDIARPACLVCRNFANDFADISVGGLGSADGYTTVLIRTTMAKRAFAEAADHGWLQLAALSDTDKKNVLSMVETVAARKRERAERRTGMQ